MGALPDTASPQLAGRRLACLCRPAGAAIVLGSSQDLVVADAATGAGIDVVRRRSGGGAVYVAPREQVWLDAYLPAGDALLQRDVARTAWWLGDLWAGALADTLSEPRSDFEVHRGGLATTAWSRVACFAGLGPGEVTLRGRKIVGLSQRRDRRGAWLHSMALVSLDATRLAGLLALEDEERAALARDLESATVTLSEVLEARARVGTPTTGTLHGLADRVESALVDRLP